MIHNVILSAALTFAISQLSPSNPLPCQRRKKLLLVMSPLSNEAVYRSLFYSGVLDLCLCGL